MVHLANKSHPDTTSENRHSYMYTCTWGKMPSLFWYWQWKKCKNICEQLYNKSHPGTLVLPTGTHLAAYSTNQACFGDTKTRSCPAKVLQCIRPHEHHMKLLPLEFKLCWYHLWKCDKQEKQSRYSAHVQVNHQWEHTKLYTTQVKLFMVVQMRMQ